ncbi:MAG: response regulator [Bacteroidota bacterium]
MILIVDDRPHNLFSLKRVLEVNGYTVDTALSGEEALKKVLRTTYSLLILDVQMPGMDGFELGEMIRGYSGSKDIPIIFLSAVNKDKEFIARGYLSGGVDYIVKPVDPDILLLKVSTVIKLSQEKNDLQKIRDSLTEEIRESRETNDHLRTEMLELETVLASLPLIAFTLNEKGQVEYVNKNWYAYSSSPQEFPDVHSDDRSYNEALQTALRKGEQFETGLRILEKSSGEYHYHHLKVTPLIQRNKLTRWVGTFTNIHKEKVDKQQLEERVQERTHDLQLRNEELTVVNHELQQFAWVVSHDLKEPLRKIQLFSQLIQERYLPTESDANRYFDRMIQSSQRMSLLINDLLEYSRLSATSLFEMTDLNALITDVLADFEDEIDLKAAKISVSILPQIEAITGQIRQVFQNLIGNALKFYRPGIIPEITISAEHIAELSVAGTPDPEGKFVRITIKDNGIGFNEKFLDKIFIIFQRLDHPSKATGTGIGLAIAKKITTKHNGLLSATSSENKGSTFILVLPVRQSALLTT